MKIEIEAPAVFYEEVKKLIHEHYQSAQKLVSFAKKYPVVYRLYLKIAALGLRPKKVVHFRSPRLAKVTGKD